MNNKSQAGLPLYFHGAKGASRAKPKSYMRRRLKGRPLFYQQFGVQDSLMAFDSLSLVVIDHAAIKHCGADGKEISQQLFDNVCRYGFVTSRNGRWRYRCIKT